ncbi:MAG: copper chaperone PCu(A)C [Nitriliruptoraceae bacterium]
MPRLLSLRSSLVVVVLMVTAAVLAACDGSGGELEVRDARSRMSPMLTGVGAVYLDISNDTEEGEQLLGASVAPSVAARVELHETFDADAGHGGMDDDGMADEDMADEDMADEDMADSGEMDGATTEPTPEGFAMMGMREIDALDVPAGEMVSLEPGGYHLMLLELADDLLPGESFDLTLEFADAGEMTVTVEVREDV